MGKITDEMNHNYYNKEKSNLPEILLEIYKASVKNGTYPMMREVFKREALPSNCFNDPKKYEGMDNFINFCASMDKAIGDHVMTSENDMSIEETRSISR